MIRWFFTFGCCCCWYFTAAQDKPDSRVDSVHLLNEIVVTGYAYHRPLSEVPAAIATVDTKSLDRFSPASFLSAVNTIPGVRMEERSPGSYRFAIRGSSLRSPFGVRNVKMYWNGLPFTDGGGNTYLNLLDFNAIGSIEIIKGPGASLYGAGSGGVLLLTSPIVKESQLQFSASGGSFGLLRYQIADQISSENTKVRIQYAHQQAEGYRQQTSMNKNSLNTDLSFRFNPKSNLSTTLFYTDLFYQTPGGLTQAEYNANPRQARPTTAFGPGAVTQQAAVYNKTIYGGLNYEYEWNTHWSNQTGVYGSFTQFENPTFLNYEKRKETNWGGRTETQYKLEREAWSGKLTFGGEFQYFKSPLTDYGNLNGSPDSVQVADRLWSTMAVLFAQTDFSFAHNVYATLGASTTFAQYRFTRLSDVPVTHQVRNFDPVLSPRVALLKRFTPLLSIYGSISKGFSPPSLAEVRPSSNTFNSTLSPEQGVSYEAGFRGSLFHQLIAFDFTAYDFQLNHTIVIQHTVNGADFYINSGKTSQPGLETFVAWNPIILSTGFVSSFRIWNSYTYNPYIFKNYIYDGVNYSGNRLTGVARDISITGMDIFTKPGVYLNITFNHTGAIPLNDANTVYSSCFALLGARGGYKILIAKVSLEFFGGVDNALNARYSLGNDLNAAAGRYFNAAATRNFYLGLNGKF